MDKIKPGFYKTERGWYFLVTYDNGGFRRAKTHVDVIEPSIAELEKFSKSDPLTPEQVSVQINSNNSQNDFLKRGLEQLAKLQHPNKTTLDAIKELESGGGKKFSSADELIGDLKGKGYKTEHQRGNSWPGDR